jgi:hypothetical protein
MSEGGAPLGNNNGAKGTEWRQAIKRALARKASKEEGLAGYRAGLNLIADKLVKAAENGDPWAIQEIGNRADGKPTQTIAGDDESPLFPNEIKVRVVKPDS